METDEQRVKRIENTDITINGSRLPLKKWRKIWASIEYDAAEGAYHYLNENVINHKHPYYVVHGR